MPLIVQSTFSMAAGSVCSVGGLTIQDLWKTTKARDTLPALQTDLDSRERAEGYRFSSLL
jgi:hypothetical protein